MTSRPLYETLNTEVTQNNYMFQLIQHTRIRDLDVHTVRQTCKTENEALASRGYYSCFWPASTWTIKRVTREEAGLAPVK